MKLKHLAFAVCVAQLLLLGLSTWDLLSYPPSYRGQAIIRIGLSVPLPLFFFYVWKRSKDT
jgi:hypothetical protein